MTTREFSVTDSSTWPVLLTAEEVAAIFRRSVGWIHKCCVNGTFVPAPKDNNKPRLWRREDVLRHAEPSKVRGITRRSA
jgi:hypothetical protein